MPELNVEIPSKILNIFEKPSRYRVAYGGRGSGKSIAFARMILLEALKAPGKYLCCRELQKSIKTSVHSLLVAEIEAMGLQRYFDWGREFLRTKDGKSEFLFFGLRTNAEEIKSTHGVRICWVEEAQAVSQFSWDMLIPTIREENSEIWATFNPQDELDPIYKMAVSNPRPNMNVCEVNYSDNPWFPAVLEDERLECLRATPEKYDWVWKGQLFINTDASVYGSWMQKAQNEGRIRTNIYDPALPVFTAWDLGYSDDTAIWWFQVAGNEVRLIDYYANHRQDMKHYSEIIYGKQITNVEYGENGKVIKFSLGDVTNQRRASYLYDAHYVPHDAANKLLQAGGRSIVDQLHEYGLKSFIVPSTSQQNQLAAARATIDLSWFDEDACSEGIRCLRKHSFTERDNGTFSQTPKHDDGFSHGCDAYEVVAQIWQSAKVEAKQAPPKFFEDMTINDLWADQANRRRVDWV